MATSEHPMKYSYGKQKLLCAMFSLIGPADQKTRLTYACGHLADLREPEKHIPEDILPDFLHFMQEMRSGQPLTTESAFEATVIGLTDTEVNAKAEKILHWYDYVCRRCTMG